MKKELLKEIDYQEDYQRTNTVRVQKSERRKEKTTLDVNKGVVGESIELMLERIREGEGEEGIADRDLVYNEGETNLVNPLTNIRSDRMELLLEQKIGEYEHKHRTIKLHEPKKEEPPKAGEPDAEAKAEK